MIGARIAGLGVALPPRVVWNAELAPRLGLTEEWIVERTGIQSRHVADEDETTSRLGAQAAQAALQDAGVDAGDVDLVVCATVTPDWRFPAAASLIQDALGLRAAAFDLNAGCSGFLYALAQADAAVRSGAATTALVVGAEILSRITDYGDPKSAALFGDGAGAAVVTRAEAPHLGPFSLYSDGSRPELLFVPNETGLISMQGREVYRAAVDGMARSVQALLDGSGISPADVKLVVAHQANQRILNAVGSRLGLGDGVVFSNIATCGNTSAASIPLALHDARSANKMQDGDLVVLTAFGAGFTWGAGLVRWTAASSTSRDVSLAGAAHG